MNAPDKDRNKVVGLVSAIILVFGLLIWRVIGASASEGKTVAVEHIGPAVGVGQPSIGGTGQPQQVVEYTPPGGGETEPFRAVLPSSNPAPTRQQMSGGNIAPLRPSGLTGNITPILPGASPDMTAAPPEPEAPRLTGIVGGDSPVASFETGSDGKSEIVGVGERLSSGWKLMAIQADGVILANKSTKLRLRIGS